ncbi:UDP-galactopyranose mutase [Pectinatus frisingensis]|uniref:UDP-galactopyranose mutase n=1 Tax=Pectinatus frisingensis TaxID=865 RepID=UPI0018C7CD1E|nr:UDP-galactopyranose mutase [Pectinatus frisingensis]
MDCLIIGCGITGAVIARNMAEKGCHVTIWDRRSHIGGNMYDFIDNHGILIHRYGPHTFHTKKKAIYEYISKYADWQPYELRCMAKINGKFTPTPFNFQTIDDFYTMAGAKKLKKIIKSEFKEKMTATVLEVMGHENESIKKYGEFLFENDYSLYTAKQWGISPDKVDPSILKRVPLRFSYETGYFDDRYQVMPQISYTKFFEKILDHENIDIRLNKEAMGHLLIDEERHKVLLDGEICNIPVIYTGALDELFKIDEGPLPYRSLEFKWKYEETDSKQPAPVVAYPQEKDFTRITEYKKLPVQDVKGTTYAIEYPKAYRYGAGNEPYYPVLTRESNELYSKYKNRADKIKNLYYCGRLADFKYYNMDQALERALVIYKHIML